MALNSMSAPYTYAVQQPKHLQNYLSLSQ